MLVKGPHVNTTNISLLSLDDMFCSLHALSGDICLLAKIWLLMWCWRGRCLVLDYIWLIPVKIQVSARTMSTGPKHDRVLTRERKCVRKAGADITESLHNLQCTQTQSRCCSTATASSSVRSPSREDFGTWVVMAERLAGPDVKVHWRPKIETVKNYPCHSTGAPAHMTLSYTNDNVYPKVKPATVEANCQVL